MMMKKIELSITFLVLMTKARMSFHYGILSDDSNQLNYGASTFLAAVSQSIAWKATFWSLGILRFPGSFMVFIDVSQVFETGLAIRTWLIRSVSMKVLIPVPLRWLLLEAGSD